MKLKAIVFGIFLSIMAGMSHSVELLQIPSKPDSGFNYPYLLKLPEAESNQERTFLIVETNNTGKVSDDYDVHLESVKNAIVGNAVGSLLSKKLSYPILMPVFPRPKSEWQVYTHALDRDSMLAKSVPFERLDLQLKAMIKDAYSVLSKHSLKLEDKVILAGFSASGTFANRFSLLHPEIIEIVVAGGLNGTLMLPTASLENHPLNYPLGINDFNQVTGSDFNLDEWLAIKQFLFMGENDTNDAVAYDDGYSAKERFIIYKTTGKSIHPERWSNTQEAYKRYGVENVTFRTFKGVGHGTNGHIHSEFLAFVQRNI